MTVLDSSDSDWWRGKCFGAVGFFPSTYVTRLLPGEKPLQVLQAVQVTPAVITTGPIKLLRDQVSLVLVVCLSVSILPTRSPK